MAAKQDSQAAVAAKSPTGSIADLFAQADLLLFKEKKYHEAESLYRQIIAIEGGKVDLEKNERNCIDALNSIGYCIKFRTTLLDLLEDRELERDPSALPDDIQVGAQGTGGEPEKAGAAIGVFSHLVNIYNQALEYDQEDVEANFNLAGIYLQRQELDQAMKYFKAAVRKDEPTSHPEVATLFA